MELKLDTDKMIARIEDGIGWMIFNQPEKRNAMSLAMRQAVPVILEEFQRNDDVRVVVMTGAGDKAFVSGADISEFNEQRATPEQIAAYNKQGEKSQAAYNNLEKPLIAMIRGFCVGGGLATALKADLRYSADNSEFGIPAGRLGLGYGYEAVRGIMDFVGPAYAAEILFTARRFKAPDAQRMGLINGYHPPDQLEAFVRETAKAIASNAPLTVKLAKTSIKEHRKDPADRDLALCQQQLDACMGSADYIEGRTAFMEKRNPQFKGR
jgi:enoyl-CoA hydratase/carnithine racemase